jgi:hypothetical protein
VFLNDDGSVGFHCYSCNDKKAIRSHLKARGLLPSQQSPEMLRSNQLAEAMEIWAAAVPVEGSVAADHFGRWRGIPSPYPNTLGYVRGPFGSYSKWVVGLVALVQDANDNVLGVHVTHLSPMGIKTGGRRSGYRRFGLLDGGGVWFGEPGGELIVGEGIETTLAAMIVLGSPWGVASLGAKGMTRLELPAGAQHVHIAADNDVAGDGQQAAAETRVRWAAEGRRVRVSTPNTAGTDFNDILIARCRNG